MSKFEKLEQIVYIGLCVIGFIVVTYTMVTEKKEVKPIQGKSIEEIIHSDVKDKPNESWDKDFKSSIVPNKG